MSARRSYTSLILPFTPASSLPEYTSTFLPVGSKMAVGYQRPFCMLAFASQVLVATLKRYVLFEPSKPPSSG